MKFSKLDLIQLIKEQNTFDDWLEVLDEAIGILPPDPGPGGFKAQAAYNSNAQKALASARKSHPNTTIKDLQKGIRFVGNMGMRLDDQGNLQFATLKRPATHSGDVDWGDIDRLHVGTEAERRESELWDDIDRHHGTIEADRRRWDLQDRKRQARQHPGDAAAFGVEHFKDVYTVATDDPWPSAPEHIKPWKDKLYNPAFRKRKVSPDDIRDFVSSETALNPHLASPEYAEALNNVVDDWRFFEEYGESAPIELIQDEKFNPYAQERAWVYGTQDELWK